VRHFEREHPAPRPVLRNAQPGRHTGAPSSGVAQTTTNELRNGRSGEAPAQNEQLEGWSSTLAAPKLGEGGSLSNKFARLGAAESRNAGRRRQRERNHQTI